MAIAFVRTTGKVRVNANPDSMNLSFAALPAAGNAVVVQAVAFENATNLDLGTGACTDNQSNTYTRAVRGPIQQVGISNDRITTAIYYDESIGSPSGTYTVTVNPAGTGSAGVIVGVATEWSGFAASSIDQTQSAGGTSGSPTTGTTGTTAQADELAMAVMACTDTDNVDFTCTSITVSGSWVDRAEELDNDAYQSCEADSLVLTSTGTQSATWTTVSPSSNDYSACIATFKAAAGAAATWPGWYGSSQGWT